MSEQEDEVLVERKRNPLLDKLKKNNPGQTFRLPSKGLFYTNGELDPETENGEVVVYPMTTVDELVMRSPDMLFQGTAITQTLAKCVPQVLKPERLIASDVDYLLTCLRRVSYGPLVPISHKCPNCEAPEKDFNVSIDHFINTAKEITQEQFDKLSVNLAETYLVKIKPCAFEEMIKILQVYNVNTMSNAEQLSDWIDNSLLAIIKSVDNVKDKDMILEWLQQLPRDLKEELSANVETINQWGLEFTYEIQCEACGHKVDVNNTLNPTGFFTLPSSPKTQN